MELTVVDARLQSVFGVSVPLIQNVPPVDALWVRKAQLGVPPNIHAAKEDLCMGRQKPGSVRMNSEEKFTESAGDRS